MTGENEQTETRPTLWNQQLARAYRMRWPLWFVAVLSHSIGIFHRAAMGPMADRIMADFNITAVAFGSLGAVYFYVYAAMQIPSGSLADTLGPRKTITLGLVCTTIGTVVMALAPTFSILYIGRIIVSFGASLEWLSVLKIIMSWFRSKEVATVTGLSGAINNSGQLIAATPLALLIIAVGWRMSFLAAAGLSLLLAIATWIIVKDDPPKAGLPSIAAIEGGAKVKTDQDPPGIPLRERFAITIRNARMWPLFFVAMGTYGSYCAFFLNWFVIYLMQTYGIARDYAATFALVSAVGAITGTSFLGFISDRIGSRRIPITVATGSSLACFLIMALWNGGKPPLEAHWVLAFVVGFGIGAMSVTFATVRDVARPEVRGLTGGFINMGAFTGAAVVQPLFGLALDKGWTGDMIEGVRHYPVEAFQQGILLSAGLMAIGFVGALMLREPWRIRVAKQSS